MDALEWFESLLEGEFTELPASVTDLASFDKWLAE